MKYFVLGAFSSAIFVYGIALTYGATGSTNLAEIAAFLARNIVVHERRPARRPRPAHRRLRLQGRRGALPHVDAGRLPGLADPRRRLHGGDREDRRLRGAAPRVCISTFPTLSQTWQPVLWVLAAATLLLGAVLALVQRDIKRMLAYSSINHAGFVLLGVQAGTASGLAGSLYYLFAYSLLVLGSFAVVGIVGSRGDESHDLDAYRGLGRRSPVLAATFAGAAARAGRRALHDGLLREVLRRRAPQWRRTPTASP